MKRKKVYMIKLFNTVSSGTLLCVEAGVIVTVVTFTCIQNKTGVGLFSILFCQQF